LLYIDNNHVIGFIINMESIIKLFGNYVGVGKDTTGSDQNSEDPVNISCNTQEIDSPKNSHVPTTQNIGHMCGGIIAGGNIVVNNGLTVTYGNGWNVGGSVFSSGSVINNGCVINNGSQGSSGSLYSLDFKVRGNVKNLTTQSGSVCVTGNIDNSVTAQSGSIQVDGNVGGNIMTSSGSCNVGGDVYGDASSQVGSVKVNGNVGTL